MKREREEFWVFRNKRNVYLVKFENLRVIILVDREATCFESVVEIKRCFDEI